jgi:hypothetical protein
MEDTVAAAPEAAPSAPWSFPRRFVAAFVSPRKLFEELAQRPSWFLPFAVALALVVLFVVGLYDPVIVPESLEKAAASGRPTAQVEQFMNTVGRVMIPSIGIATAVVITFVYTFFVWLIGGFMLGGTLRFKQALSVVTHASLVALPGFLIRVPLALIAKSSQVTVGPGMLFPGADAEGFGGHFLSAFLGWFDLFNLWQTALVALGVSVVARVSPGKANAGIWTLFVVGALVGGLLAGIFGSMGGH